MKEKLKPCPFCGKEIELPKLYNTDIPGVYAVQCPFCGAWSPEAKTTIGAIEAWNRRVEK